MIKHYTITGIPQDEGKFTELVTILGDLSFNHPRKMGKHTAKSAWLAYANGLLVYDKNHGSYVSGDVTPPPTNTAITYKDFILKYINNPSKHSKGNT